MIHIRDQNKAGHCDALITLHFIPHASAAGKVRWL